MIKCTRIFYGLFVLLIIISCNNKSKTDSPKSKLNKETLEQTQASTATDIKEVKASVEKLNNTIVNPDKAILESLVADEITYGHSSGLVQDKEEFIDDLVNGDFKFISVDISDQSITMAGETAVVRHTFSAEAKNAEKPVNIQIGNVLVYQNQDGQWKLLARQAFKL